MSQPPLVKTHIITIPIIAIVNPAAFKLISEDDSRECAIFSKNFFGRIDHANPSITRINAKARIKVSIFTIKLI